MGEPVRTEHLGHAALECIAGLREERDGLQAELARVSDELDEANRRRREQVATSTAWRERAEQAESRLERYERVAESPWSFHRGSLRERLEWCRDQHAYAAAHPPPAPMEREAKQDFDRACVAWYDEMLGQLAEIEAALLERGGE